MDLIYTDKNKTDIGVLANYELDLAYGTDENDFECVVDTENNFCEAGCILYVYGTDYGGIIDKIKVDTARKSISYSGRTWHGIMEKKVLCPDTGADYLVLSGEANTVLGRLITRMGLDDMFSASTENSGIQINNYRMNRYISGYAGIRKMLASSGAKLMIRYINGMIRMSAVPLVDYSQDEEWDSSQMDFVIEKDKRPVNHMVCLGQGELKERTVIHLYMDESGNISKTQSLTGIEEITEVYDNPNAESMNELEAGGREKLEEYWAEANSLNVDFNNDESYDIGDIVGAREEITGVSVSREIVKKIVTINKSGTKIVCQIGER